MAWLEVSLLQGLVRAIMQQERVCISTELKWRCADYGFYQHETAKVAGALSDIEEGKLSISDYPSLQGKRIYKFRRDSPSASMVSRKAKAYCKIVETQQSNHLSGLFAQAVITLAFWKAAISFGAIKDRMAEAFLVSTRPQYYLGGRVPELDIFFLISRGYYGIDVKNDLEMLTLESTVDRQGRKARELIDIWYAHGVWPVIACPMSARGLKSELIRRRGRSYDYLTLLLLEDDETRRAFDDLGMTWVRFLPQIEVDGMPCNGQQFFEKVNRIIESDTLTLDELVSHVKFENPTLSALTLKSEGLFALLALQNRMDNTLLYGSKADAMRRAVEYLIYQYVCASRDQRPVTIDTLTSYVRSQHYLAAAQPLAKLSIGESTNVVENSGSALADIGLVSFTSSGIANKFGRRPEEFMTVRREKIRKDFGL